MSKILPFSTTRHEPLISPIELFKEFPTTIAQKDFVEQSRQQIIRILDGIDQRLLLIMGPCSIHDLKSAEHYAKKLKELTSEVSDIFFPVMRVYFEKARTSIGWKGLMYDPHLDSSFDINSGLRITRELLLLLAELQVPAAAEILDPVSGEYFGDLLSWGCIGARTSSSQIHRQAASSFSIPIGFKNNTDGNVSCAINGIISAGAPHAFVGINQKGTACIIHSEGNPHCHMVLRGGEKGPNYDAKSLDIITQKLKAAKLPEKIIVDCSHDNSGRDYTKQPEVFENVIDQVASGNRAIKGCILESHLRAGSQRIPVNPDLLKYAISLTDACMDWETTEGLILSAKKVLLTKIPSLNQVNTVSSDTQKAVLV